MHTLNHGASGFKEMFIGSNAEKVVRSSDVPVLIIKKDLYKDKLTKNIIIFIIGTLVALPFWYVFDHDKMKLFVTFCVGTSIHDLLIKTLGTLYSTAIKKITNKAE
jgi:hypothetical protein